MARKGTQGGFLKPVLGKRGGKSRYYGVVLCKNHIIKGVTIHRLVAETYLLNPNNYPQINHRDGDKLNNHVLNLEWCTALQNMRHAISTGLIKHGCKINKQGVRLLNNRYKSKPWVAMLGRTGNIAKGYFATEQEAIDFRKAKMLELYPELFKE